MPSRVRHSFGACRTLYGFALPAAAVLFSIVLVSCTTGPTPPAPGTPAFYWGAAQETFLAGDYVKTSEHLERLTRSTSEYTGRAQVMRLVVSSGLMLGYKDLAEQYEYGARANKANPMPFRKRVTANRGLAGRYAMQVSEGYSEFRKGQKNAEVVLAFPFPARGAMAIAPQMPKVAQGLLVPDADLESAQVAMLQRGVVQAVCRAAGAPGDPPKAKELLKAPPFNVANDAFQFGMAQSLYDASILFSELKANLPQAQDQMLRQAAEAVALAPAGKAADELKKKIEEDLKKLAKRRKMS
jgi:hypothetical protein